MRATITTGLYEILGATVCPRRIQNFNFKIYNFRFLERILFLFW
jgi:hypothetical protein